jgi:predicted ATP-dependent protease
MDRNDENIGQYVNFIKMVTQEEELREPDLSGIKEIIRYGISLSEQKDKLSTRFSLVADLIREANYWANAAGEESINQKSVITAIKKRKYLYDLPEEKINSMILKGEILIKVDGDAVGRVNGLAIHDRGYYSFGTPTVISAQVTPGNEGIINIEREAGLSGEIHDKGLMILEGYLRDKYARNFPLSVYGSICFEQSYSEIDGDSASSTEIYGLLSAIAAIPLKQYIAVTGSINQMGQIQPVGGITEKVLGFFTICRQSGLTGRQGVLIPEQNINNLILPKEVSDEIRDGNFHIYPVSSIDEGIEVLTGMEAGIRNKKGNYTPGSFNYAVEVRLKEIAQLVKAYNG